MKTLALLALLLAGCAADADDAAPADAAAAPADAAAGDAAPADAAADDAAPADAAADASAPACPAPRPLRECFRGAAFADCGGDGEPAVFCGSPGAQAEDCLWFTGGCPAAEHPTRCVPSYGQGQAWAPCAVADQFADFGREPWTRDRAMRLALRVDPTLALAEPFVACDACGAENPPPSWSEGRCFPGTSVCAPDEPEAQFELFGPWLRPAPDAADWALPSLVAVALGRNDGFTGQTLVLELDFERGTARACLVKGSDTPIGGSGPEPPCADAGEVVVDGAPASADDVAGLHGRFDLTFPKYSPWREVPPFVTGLRVTGAF